MLVNCTPLLLRPIVGIISVIFITIFSANPAYSKDNLANFSEGSAHYTVQLTANRLIAALTDNPDKLKAEPNGYERVVNEVLVPVIDDVLIAKRVMGKQYYTAATPEQREAFRVAFQKSLVSTYSSGLSLFESQKITVLPPKKGTEQNKKQLVNMEVKTADGTIFPLRFSVKQDDAGNWKVFNVLLNGVNVGKAYNSHFAESMVKHGNNLDALIANWNSNLAPDFDANNSQSDRKSK